MIIDLLMFFVTKILIPLFALYLAILLAGIFIVLPLAFLSGWKSPEQKMYKHCIEDGNTDYYCYHMTHTLGGKYD